MIIRYLEPSDYNLWNDYILRHPVATHCHLIGWKDIIEVAYNLQSFYLLAQSGSQIVGALPMFHIKSIIFGNQIVSMPYLNYGGILADNSLTSNLLLNKAYEISREFNIGSLEFRHVEALNEDVFGDKTRFEWCYKCPNQLYYCLNRLNQNFVVKLIAL